MKEKARKVTAIAVEAKWQLKIVSVFIVSVSLALSANGKLIDDTYDVNTIKRIRLLGNVHVVLVEDTVCYDVVEYPDTVTDWEKVFLFTIEQETLTIQTIEGYGNENWRQASKMSPLVIAVTPDLREIEHGYDSILEVKATLATPSLKVRQSGNGMVIIDNLRAPQITLSILTGRGKIKVRNMVSDKLVCDIIGTGSIEVENGICKEMKCKTVGTGKMNLVGVKSQIVNISSLGGGFLKCHAVEKLSVSGLGSTKIHYVGSPKIKRRGTLRPNRITEQ